MTLDQALIFVILAAALVLFAWGRWRHDLVALAALLAAVAAGLVEADAAFAGFGHPAVITVACVLILSRGLQTSGAIDVLAQRVLPSGAPPVAMLAALCGLAALLSGFMNNVGALALMMPLALQAAARADWPPGRMLMPLAFASILGGMTTLIGTPPNLIVSSFRDDELGGAFGMFAFAPVGVAVAAAGTAFVVLIGWRLVPARRRAGVEGFEAGAYVTEARVPGDARIVGETLREIEERLEEADAQIIGLVRREVRLRAPRPQIRVAADDILVIEAEPEGLAKSLTALGITLEEDVAPEDDEGSADRKDRDGRDGTSEDDAAAEQRRAVANLAARLPRSPLRRDRRAREPAAPSERPSEGEDGADRAKPRPDDGDIVLAELVVPPNAALIGRSATEINLRIRYGINLLALSRSDERTIGRLRSVRFAAGDVLLLQGPPEAIAGFASEHGCLPLAERTLRIPDRKRMALAVGAFLAAIAVTAAGLVPVAVAFAGAVLAVVVTRVVPPRAVYTAVDWPVIVLLGALLPVADAMQTTGAAALVAETMVAAAREGGAIVALAAILTLTMLLSAVMNNAATVAVLAPVAIGTAGAFDASSDAFLMAVAVGGSCAFLTPIAHQNNTLILGPGGFRFGDYWRLGLPLTLLVIAVALPMIVLVWGL